MPQVMPPREDASGTAPDGLYERYATPAFRYVRALGLREADAEDVVAESFLRILRAQGNPPDGEFAAGWIFTVVRHTAVNFMRWRTRQEKLRDAASQEGRRNTECDPAQAVQEEEMVRALSEAIEALPAEQRHALALVGVAGLSYREAAEVEGITEAALTSRLFQARKAIRERLGED